MPVAVPSWSHKLLTGCMGNEILITSNASGKAQDVSERARAATRAFSFPASVKLAYSSIAYPNLLLFVIRNIICIALLRNEHRNIFGKSKLPFSMSNIE